MVKRVVLTPPDEEAISVFEFVLFLVLFVLAMNIGVLAYLDHKGMIDLHPQTRLCN